MDIAKERGTELRQLLTLSLLSESTLLHDEALSATATDGGEISDRLNWIKEAHARFGGARRVGCSCAIVQDSPVETFNAKTNLHKLKIIIIDIFKDNIN